MASAAYTAWLSEFATSRVVLAELQPAEKLTAWTAQGVYTDVYQKSWASQAEADVVTGGVYRRLDSVEQNETSLTSRASLVALDAAASGYFHDSANSLIYVKTTTGSAPDTFAAVLALFTVFFATKPVDFVGGNLYEPRLTDPVPVVEMSTEDPLYGIKVYASGDLALSNADKLFDKLGRKWLWKNRAATIKFGGGSLAYSDYETIAVMRIDDAAPNDDIFTLTLQQMATVLEKTLPLNTITLASYPNAGQGVAGTYKPLLWGAKTGIPGVLVDSTSGAQVYLVADPAVQVLTAVSAVRATKKDTGVVTTLTLTTHYTVSLAGCTVTVTSVVYNDGEYDISIDAAGETDGAGSYLSSGGEIAKDLLLALGEVAANIDSTSFSDADTDNDALLGLWVREPKRADEYLRLIERSVFGSVYVGRDGLWRMEIWDPTYDTSTIPTLVDQDFATWEVDDKLELVLYGARVKYDQNPSTAAWQETETTNETVRYAYKTTEMATVETCLLDSSAAATVAQRYRLLAGSPRMHVQTQERGLSHMTAQPFDKVLVTRARAPSEDGTYSGYVMEVLEVRKTLVPPKVDLLLGNLRGFGARVGRWADSSAPDWSAATASERDRDGHWADSSGYVVPADASTLDMSIWY